jgi:hypothetical protein
MIHSLTPRDLFLRDPYIFENFGALNQPFVLIHVHEHRCAPTALREHDWPMGGLHLFDKRRRVSPKFGEGPDIFTESNAHNALSVRCTK